MELNYSQKWERDYRRRILNELTKRGIEICVENIERIIEAISFKVLSKESKNESKLQCPYYELGKPCHDIYDLNCFLCACPNYESDKLEGGCRISSIFGKMTFHANLPAGKIWDCSSCCVNHSPKEVEKYLREHIKELKDNC